MMGASMGYVPPPERKRRNVAEIVFWIMFCGLGCAGILALGVTVTGMIVGELAANRFKVFALCAPTQCASSPLNSMADHARDPSNKFQPGATGC